MRKTAFSRRTMFGGGACVLAAAAAIPRLADACADEGLSSRNEATVRKYYKGWEAKDWRAFDMLLTDDFTFSSPIDARISKSVFKKGCWDTQIAFIGRFDLLHVAAAADDAFVMYVCHTANGRTFRNVEYLRLRGARVASVECYFGGKNSYTSAVAQQK